jgi:hypothetical protein
VIVIEGVVFVAVEGVLVANVVELAGVTVEGPGAGPFAAVRGRSVRLARVSPWSGSTTEVEDLLDTPTTDPTHLLVPGALVRGDRASLAPGALTTWPLEPLLEASLGSVLSVRPRSNNRTRDDSFGGTSTTRSPAATSCWASIAPIPRRSLNRPNPRLERRRPLEQASSLTAIGFDPQAGNHRLCVVDRGGGVGPLVGVDPDHEHGMLLAELGGLAPAGTPDVG